ncbi:MAG: FAD-dependent oxidoreductase [Candidatus Bathyarchaeia archaeon]
MNGIIHTDVVIIGAGPAGLTAAIYTGWLGLKTVILESGIAGGRAYLAPKLENYPGFPNGIKGSELVEKMRQQTERFKAQLHEDEEVISIELVNSRKRAVTRKQTYEAKVLIITTGTQRRKLKVAGETEYIGKGVSYCTICDGPFFRKKVVTVVGNSEEAAIDALALSDLANKITIISQMEELEMGGAVLDRLKNKNNVEFVMGKVTGIIGDQVVKAIKIKDFITQQESEREVNGVFIALGGVPLTAIVQGAGITTDRTGCLMVDRHQQTSVAGIFAAGDCTCGGMQVATAVGEGALAGMKASAYIRRGSS